MAKATRAKAAVTTARALAVRGDDEVDFLGSRAGSTPIGAPTVRAELASLRSRIESLVRHEGREAHEVGTALNTLYMRHADAVLGYDSFRRFLLAEFADDPRRAYEAMLVARAASLSLAAEKGARWVLRAFTWARIDIPGPNDLWVVSVHLLTANASTRNSEAVALVSRFAANVPSDDYLLLGGDFNTDNRGESAFTTFSSRFVVTGPYPADQKGNGGTNSSRSKPYDNVLASPCLDRLQGAVRVGASVYPSGLVIDTTVYTPLTELAPAQFGDSNASNMQHMGVVRDFFIQP